MAAIDNKCTNCSICIENCPTGSISKYGNEISVNENDCIHCNTCTETCTDFPYKRNVLQTAKSGKKLKIGIVGCGVSGIRTANELFQSGHEVTILTKEHLLYDRPNLYSYFLRKGPDLSRTIDAGVKILRDTNVINVKKYNKQIVLKTTNGEHCFDRLVITTGARANNFGECNKLENVFSFWGHASVKKMVEFIKANHVLTASVIGGGSIGIEAAFFLSELGLSVTIFEKAETLLAGRLDEYINERILEDMKRRSITCKFKSEVTNVCSDGVCVSGELYNSQIIVTTGASPDIECFRDSKLDINKGIIVNEKMETNIEGIYAAGDAVEYKSKVTSNIRNALEQASVITSSICGRSKKFGMSPHCEILKNVPSRIVVAGEKDGMRKIVRKYGDVIRIVFVDEKNRINGFQSINDSDGVNGILYNAMKRKLEISDDFIHYEHSILQFKKGVKV